jgi:hypothetical protein
MEKLTFNKELGKWYIDLPTWEGDKEELEMVAGADILLDKLSNNEDTVSLFVSQEEVDDSIILKKKYNINGGADYKPVNTDIVYSVWLCGVTKFVFGGIMPQMLYIKTTV